MTTPLRIAILGSSSFPIAEPFAGGMEAHIWELAHTLTSRGHTVTLFAAEGSATDVSAHNLSVARLELSDISKASNTSSALAVSEHHAYLSVMLDLATTLADEFDVVHNHSLHYLPIAMARTLTTPMVTTLHTPPFAMLESAVAIAEPPPAGFLAVSEHLAGQWAPVLGTVDVVPNGIALDRWPVGSGGEYAVWSGRVVPEKGPHLAIDAAVRAGVPLRIAGPIWDEQYFHDFVAPRLGGEIVYEGHLRRQELARLVGGAAVALVTPVWDEPYGLVVAEALACGTPVAAFDRGGIPEIVDRSCARLAPADDVAALADALTQAMLLPRRAARARAESVCAGDRMVDRYEERYASAIVGAAG